MASNRSSAWVSSARSPRAAPSARSANGSANVPGQRRMQRPFRVVLMRRGGTEGGHHRIADELLNRPPGPLDLRRHSVVKAIQHRPDPFGILLAREFSGAHEIGEQNRRDLPLLSWHTEILPYHPVRQGLSPANHRWLITYFCALGVCDNVMP